MNAGDLLVCNCGHSRVYHTAGNANCIKCDRFRCPTFIISEVKTEKAIHEFIVNLRMKLESIIR